MRTTNLLSFYQVNHPYILSKHVLIALRVSKVHLQVAIKFILMPFLSLPNFFIDIGWQKKNIKVASSTDGSNLANSLNTKQTAKHQSYIDWCRARGPPGPRRMLFSSLTALHGGIYSSTSTP
jgi:hypothetical protein